jgi:hypothetical protein
MKNLENLLFGENFRQGVKDAVQEAVAAANAKGLPKAYEPAFSQAKIIEAGIIDARTHKAIDAGQAPVALEKKPMRAA